jgi:sortase B
MRKRIFLNLLIFFAIIFSIYKAFNTIEIKKDTAAISNKMIITNTSQDDKISKLERQIKEQKSNTKIIAGIYIPNTIINYLVVKGEDNEFYLSKDINGNEDNHGAIFMDYINKANNSDKNTIIYGHNMKDGTMFTDLCKYKERQFFNENRYIYLCTSKGMTKWEIFSAYVTTKQYFNYICVL